jgi:hypothetical protein
MHIFTDGFTSVSLSNGNLRVKPAQNSPDKVGSRDRLFLRSRVVE